MSKIIPMIVLLLLSLYAINKLHFQPQAPEFLRWKSQYAIEFQTQSQQFYRKKIFEANLIKIDQHNANKDNTYQIGVNQFSIFTEAEFVQRYLNSNLFANNKYEIHSEDKELKAVIIDWSLKGAVSPVKNQGACGAAGVFSTLGGVEGLSFVKTGHLQVFSQQQLIDCVYGCTGGFITEGYRYYQSYGACTAQQYPSSASPTPQTCKNIYCAFKISKYVQVSSCSELSNAIQIEPVSVAVDASNWSPYKSGIFNNCGKVLNHMVLLTGLANEYWKCKNSWGTSWGESGFIRLAPNNTCGICSFGVYPLK